MSCLVVMEDVETFLFDFGRNIVNRMKVIRAGGSFAMFSLSNTK